MPSAVVLLRDLALRDNTSAPEEFPRITAIAMSERRETSEHSRSSKNEVVVEYSTMELKEAGTT